LLLFREATPGDGEAVDSIAREAGLGVDVQAALASDQKLLFVLSEEETVVAFVSAVRVAGEVEIFDMAVRRGLRGEGRGLRLLSDFLDLLAREGTSRVILEVSAANAPGRRLYRRAGFFEVGRRKAYYPSGEDALLLERTS
jgi:ribosomal-protein-alanine N-acetyltransferase